MPSWGKRVGLADAEAMIVKTQRPGGMKGMPENTNAQPGMGSAADTALSVADQLSGGAISGLEAELEELRTYLKISIACSILAGGFALMSWISARKR